MKMRLCALTMALSSAAWAVSEIEKALPEDVLKTCLVGSDSAAKPTGRGFENCVSNYLVSGSRPGEAHYVRWWVPTQVANRRVGAVALYVQGGVGGRVGYAADGADFVRKDLPSGFSASGDGGVVYVQVPVSTKANQIQLELSTEESGPLRLHAYSLMAENHPQLWVSPSGDDAATGSRWHPLKTFDGVSRAMAALKRQMTTQTCGVLVYFMGGTWTADKPFCLGDEISGVEGFPARIFSYARGASVLSGGTPLTLRPLAEGELPRQPDASRAGVRVAELAEGIPSEGNEVSLFEENARLTLKLADKGPGVLEKAGDWTYDRAARKVYVWPRRQGSVPVLAAKAGVLVVSRAHDVIIDGFSIEQARDLAVRFVDCTNVMLRCARVRETSGWGVSIEGGRNVQVVGCDLDDLGGGGISVSGGNPATREKCGNAVENCIVGRCGIQDGKDCPGIVLKGCGCRASHNLVHHLPAQGIVFEGGAQDVSNNMVHDVCRTDRAAGAIHGRAGTPAGDGSRIENNCVHMTGVPADAGNRPFAIRLDAGVTKVDVRGNVLSRASGLRLPAGSAGAVERNVFVEVPDCVRREGPFARPDGVRNNVLVASGALDEGANNVAFAGDPGFTNYRGGDWTLKADSPARQVLGGDTRFADVGLRPVGIRFSPFRRFGKGATPPCRLGIDASADKAWAVVPCPTRTPSEPLLTEWGERVTPENAWRREYPRPQLVRREWTNLNGLWDYAVTPSDPAASPFEERERADIRSEGKILVPFPIESSLSGVGRLLAPDEWLWYRRTIDVKKTAGRRILLNFGAVDYRTQVFVGHREVTDVPHEGGSEAFQLDLTDYVSDGPNELVVCVWDPTTKGPGATGKQSLEPEGCHYTRMSGIWQTVWLEEVPEAHVTDLVATPQYDRGSVAVSIDVAGSLLGAKVKAEVLEGEQVVAAGEFVRTDRPLEIKLPSGWKSWSPESPHLYDLRVTLTAGDGAVDAVASRFGMRKFEKRRDGKGVWRFFLNGEPYFPYGTLDQGWWPDGLLTPPSEEAIRYEIRTLKALGFNMLRKHIKVEPACYYRICDEEGLLVFQDMPCGHWNDVPVDVNARYGRYRAEFAEIVSQLRSFPSIVMWCPYNEGWTQPGEHLTHVTLDWVKRLDPTRLVDGPSGWVDYAGGDRYWSKRGGSYHRPDALCEPGDVIDNHTYRGPAMFPANPRRISLLGEFGGLGQTMPGHLWKPKNANWGYGGTFGPKDAKALENTYSGLIRRLIPMVEAGLAGAVYTQTSDVEIEVNGMMTYDRKVLKFDPKALSDVHRRLYAAARSAAGEFQRETKTKGDKP